MTQVAGCICRPADKSTIRLQFFIRYYAATSWPQQEHTVGRMKLSGKIIAIVGSPTVDVPRAT